MLSGNLKWVEKVLTAWCLGLTFSRQWIHISKAAVSPEISDIYRFSRLLAV